MPVLIKSYEEILTFGKHKGKSISEIIEEDIDYIFWLLQENIVSMNKEMIDALEWDSRIESEELKQIYFD